MAVAALSSPEIQHEREWGGRSAAEEEHSDSVGLHFVGCHRKGEREIAGVVLTTVELAGVVGTAGHVGISAATWKKRGGTRVSVWVASLREEEGEERETGSLS